MKSSLRRVIAAICATGTATLALAQAAPAAQPAATAPAAANAAQSEPRYAEEPVASTTRGGGPNADVANAIVQALNADASMKRSKITVQPEDTGILLTGVTATQAQRQRAHEIATGHAGEGKVSNAILTEQVVVAAG